MANHKGPNQDAVEYSPELKERLIVSQGTLEGMCGATILNQLACGKGRGTGSRMGEIRS